MKVLVAYGSRMGSTAGIAEMIAHVLAEAGIEAEVRAASSVEQVDDYGAVIVGGALYNRRWHKDARRLVQRHAAELSVKPVWLFSSGPLDHTATTGQVPPVAQVKRLMHLINARGHDTFGGRIPESPDWFPASIMARNTAGDWRDPFQIEGWAREVARSLCAEPISR